MASLQGAGSLVFTGAEARCLSSFRRYPSLLALDGISYDQLESHSRHSEALGKLDHITQYSIRNALNCKSTVRPLGRSRIVAQRCRKASAKLSYSTGVFDLAAKSNTRLSLRGQRNVQLPISCKVCGPPLRNTNASNTNYEPGSDREDTHQVRLVSEKGQGTSKGAVAKDTKFSTDVRDTLSLGNDNLQMQELKGDGSVGREGEEVLRRPESESRFKLDDHVTTSSGVPTMETDDTKSGYASQNGFPSSRGQDYAPAAQEGTKNDSSIERTFEGNETLTIRDGGVGAHESPSLNNHNGTLYEDATSVTADKGSSWIESTRKMLGKQLQNAHQNASRHFKTKEEKEFGFSEGIKTPELSAIPVSQPWLDSAETPLPPSQHDKLLSGSATQTAGRALGFRQIVKNDMEFLAEKVRWTKEVALPSFTKSAEKFISLRQWEDPTAVPTSRPPWPRPKYPELSGLDLVAADVTASKVYAEHIKGWFVSWRIPLQPSYDAEMIMEYFNRRPHVLLIRLLEVFGAFASVVLKLEAEKAFSSFIGSGKKVEEMKLQSGLKGAELLKETLVKLGPTFIKVGQSLATRPDLVGPDTAKVLAELQDRLPPFPTEEAMSVIEEDFGCPVNEIFEYLSKEPVAGASFGQVYKGRTADGQDVAVKVQRPNLLYSVALDIYILRMGLAIIRKLANRKSDLKLYADELGQGLFGELDYRLEATNAIEFKAVHSKLQFLVVPNILPHLTTKRVLTMEWIDGDRPKELLLVSKGISLDGRALTEQQQVQAKYRLFSLVNKGVEASLVQLLDTGVLHADPHPGNLLYTPNGQMAFLDFGLLCRMEKHHQMAMLASAAHIVNADWKCLVDDLADMDVLRPDINRRAIQVEMEEALADSVPKDGLPDIKFSKVLVKILKIALKHQFKMPPYFILVLRSIASLEGLALAVDPDFKVFAAAYPYVVQRILTDKSTHTRKVLFSLVLDENREFRWNRLALFATLAREHSMKRIALENTAEMHELKSPMYGLTDSSTEMVTQLASRLLSKDGVVLRRLVLEADTRALARAFSSRKGAIFRRHIAKIVAGAFYEQGKIFLRENLNITLTDSADSVESLLTVDVNATQQTTESMKDKVKLSVNTSSAASNNMFRNRHFRFLLQTIIARMRKVPLLMAQVGWNCFTIFCYAFAVASHKLIVAVCHKLLYSSSQLATRTGTQLSPA